MKAKSYSVSIFFERRRFKKGTNKSPIELTVNLSGSKQFRIRLKLYSTREDFDRAMTGRGGTEEVKELRRSLNEFVSKAETILDNLPNPNKDSFIRVFKSSTELFTSNKTDITYFFEERVRELNEEERFGTASTFKLALRTFKKYSSSTNFEDIDERYLKGFVAWNKQKGNSDATSGIYLRNMKAIFNRAIKEGFISERLNPFKGYKIGSVERSKNVLYPEQIEQLWSYNPVGVRESRAKAMFFFCYLGNGMNFKDVAYLKWENVQKDMLTFMRAKTIHTNRRPKQIRVYLREELKSIMNEWGGENKSSNSYIFPYVGNSNDPLTKEKSKQRWQGSINTQLRAIGKKLGFDMSLNLSLARHSFATSLKLDRTPISFISDAMGHSSTSTTEFYLKTIPDEMYKELSNSLLKFKN